MTEQSPSSDSQTYAIIGAAMEVHRVRGPGFHEIVYRDCCAIEFNERNIPFVMEVPFPVTYKGHPVGGHYRADFVCYGEIIVEIKATGAKNTPAEHAQMLNYLAASGKERGLLLNFGGPRLTFQRFVMSSNGQPTTVEEDLRTAGSG
jgi:GxxExxY protein